MCRGEGRQPQTAMRDIFFANVSRETPLAKEFIKRVELMAWVRGELPIVILSRIPKPKVVEFR